MESLRATGSQLALLGVVLSLAACRDIPGPPSQEPSLAAIWQGVVSDPVAAGSSAALAVGSPLGTDIVYISLAPGTLPGGEVASIRNRVTGSGVVAAMVAGGLDPVPVAASAGDTLDIDVRLAGSDSTVHFVHAVAAARRPIVVRTDPPPRKRDVPLNAVMLVVFSEPIDPATLTGAAVQLLPGTTPVAGQLEFRDPANLTAAFVPAAPLAASTDYRLIVTQGIRDLDGEALEAAVAVDFTTEPPGRAATQLAITVQPTTTVAGAVIEPAITVTATDTLGNTATDFTGIVTITIGVNPGNGTLSGTTTVAADTGVATFANLRIGSSGTGYTLIAMADGLENDTSIAFDVTPNASVVGVEISDVGVTLAPGEAIGLIATSRDAGGGLVNGPVSWASTNTSVATVSPDGLVTAVSIGTTTISANTWGLADSVEVAVTRLVFASLEAGVGFTCGLTTEGAAYCWGLGVWGQLGTGSLRSARTPVPVAGGLRFATLSLGRSSACGLTLSGEAYCWGANWGGQLGSVPDEVCVQGGSTFECTSDPLAVVGGLTFTFLSAGGSNVCGLSSDGAAHCWGMNNYGQLGSGTASLESHTPVAVARGLIFATIIVGRSPMPMNTACGITPQNTSYCWGSNFVGALGNGSLAGPETCVLADRSQYPCSTVPVLVSGGLEFGILSVSYDHSCGLTPNGAAFCWGNNGNGAVGVGEPDNNVYAAPTAVSGGLVFRTIAVSRSVTCALETAGAAFCWGELERDSDSLVRAVGSPEAVPGGLAFASLSVGENHRCALTVAGTAYCWGWQEAGELGNGSKLGGFYTPTKVMGQP